MLEITNVLNMQKIDYALIKGFDIVNKVYNPVAPHTRDFNDIDILVDKEDLSKTSKVVESLGYVQGDVNNLHTTIKEATRVEKLEMQMRSHQIYSYVSLDIYDDILNISECTLIDINFTPFEGGEQTPKISTKELLKECNIMATSSGYYKSLNIYYTFIQLAYHLYKDTKYKRKKEIRTDITIQKFCDIREFLRYAQNKWDLENLIQLIWDNNLTEAIYFVLFFTQKMYDEKSYDAYLERICPKNEAFFADLKDFDSYFEEYYA